MTSIGGQLRAARERRGLSLPDIEHELRIPQSHLHDLEDDEYANFANLTYGKFFLARYSDFLGVNTNEFQKEFTTPELGSVEDYPYLQEPSENLRGIAGSESGFKKTSRAPTPAARSTPTRGAEMAGGQNKALPLLLASVAGLVAMGALLFFMRGKSQPETADTEPPAEEVSPAVPSSDSPATETPATPTPEIAPAGSIAAGSDPLVPAPAPAEGATPAPRALPVGESPGEGTTGSLRATPADGDLLADAATDTRPPEQPRPTPPRGRILDESLDNPIPPGGQPVAIPPTPSVPRAIPLQ